MNLIEDMKREEGFRGFEYIDTEGFKTIGFGTKLPLTEKEAELLLEYRLNGTKSQIDSIFYKLDIPPDAWNILYNMGYQLGVNGLLKFRKMIKALEKQDYIEASKEGLDSLWAKQTPKRAKRLMARMEKVA